MQTTTVFDEAGMGVISIQTGKSETGKGEERILS